MAISSWPTFFPYDFVITYVFFFFSRLVFVFVGRSVGRAKHAVFLVNFSRQPIVTSVTARVIFSVCLHCCSLFFFFVRCLDVFLHFVSVHSRERARRVSNIVLIDIYGTRRCRIFNVIHLNPFNRHNFLR